MELLEERQSQRSAVAVGMGGWLVCEGSQAPKLEKLFCRVN